MNKIKFTVLALMMTFSLVFASGVEAKQNFKNSHAHSKSTKHTKQKNTKRSSPHKSKKNSQKNHHTTAKKVNQKAAPTFQKQGKNSTPANISPSAIKHIQDRHWYNAKQGANTSHFNSSMTDQKLNQLATKTINEGSKMPSTHGQGRITHQYKFEKPVGTTSTGGKAHSLRVVTDAQNNVITAFPVN